MSSLLCAASARNSWPSGSPGDTASDLPSRSFGVLMPDEASDTTENPVEFSSDITDLTSAPLAAVLMTLDESAMPNVSEPAATTCTVLAEPRPSISRKWGRARHLPELNRHLRRELISGELLEHRKKFRIDQGIWVCSSPQRMLSKPQSETEASRADAEAAPGKSAHSSCPCWREGCGVPLGKLLYGISRTSTCPRVAATPLRAHAIASSMSAHSNIQKPPTCSLASRYGPLVIRYPRHRAAHAAISPGPGSGRRQIS